MPDSDPQNAWSEPGALQVEQMPESDELVKRRESTQSQLKETAVVPEPVAVPDSTGMDDVFDDGGGVMDLLREANLTPRHLRFCCGGILGVLLLGLLVWGGWSFFTREKSVEDPVIEPDPVVDEDPEVEVPDYSGQPEYTVTVPEAIDPSLWAGILGGQIELGDDLSTDLGQDLGEQDYSEDQFTQMVLDLSAALAAVELDVNQMLDASTQRRASLEEYRETLRYMQYQGGRNQEALAAQLQGLAQSLEQASSQKSDAEELFFERLSQLDAFASSAALNQFIVRSASANELQAQLSARRKLLEYYDLILKALDARLRAVELNEEALVKGVRVVEVEGSGIDLVLDESEL